MRAVLQLLVVAGLVAMIALNRDPVLVAIAAAVIAARVVEALRDGTKKP